MLSIRFRLCGNTETPIHSSHQRRNANSAQASRADLRIQKPVDGLFPKSSRQSGFQSGPANTATVPTEAGWLREGGGG